jgi:hypothetical protein
MLLLFAVGLLLTLAAGTLWTLSFQATRDVHVHRVWRDGDANVVDDFVAGVRTTHFQVWWSRTREPAGDWDLAQSARIVSFGTDDPARFQLRTGSGSLWQRLGFWLYYEMSERTYRLIDATVPPWFVALVFATFTAGPGWSLRRHARRHRRAASGLCVACGYDLRGAAHERCPECGAVVASAVDAPARV